MSCKSEMLWCKNCKITYCPDCSGCLCETTKEDWRKIDEKDVEVFSQEVKEEFLQRRQVGIAKYGREFQGDPLVHQREEILDALFYNWASTNERKWLMQRIEQMNLLLEEIIEYFTNLTIAVPYPEGICLEAKKILLDAKGIKEQNANH